MAEYETNEPFTITDDGKAEWAMKKIAEADAELERMSEWYVAQIEAAKQRHTETVSYFSNLLRGYMDKVPAKDTKTMRKYALPSGELIISKAKKDFTISDADELLGWCQMNDATLVKVKMEPSWSAVKKRLQMTDAGVVDTETGLVVSGVTEMDIEESFKVKLKEETK